jgi:hypothetical protein
MGVFVANPYIVKLSFPDLRDQVWSRLVRYRLELQRFFDFDDHGVEGGGIEDGDFGEALAVELDVGGFEAGDELAVAEVALAAGGAEARDPEAAELALSDAAVAKGEGAGAVESFLDGAEELAASADKTFGPLVEAFVGLGAGGTLASTHGRRLSCLARQGPEASAPALKCPRARFV